MIAAAPIAFLLWESKLGKYPSVVLLVISAVKFLTCLKLKDLARGQMTGCVVLVAKGWFCLVSVAPVEETLLV